MARRRSSRELQVSISFEAIRIAPQCLAVAYEQVVPIARRPVRTAGSCDASPEVTGAHTNTKRRGAERG